MAVNRLPYFPLDVDDYLNDSAVMAMDADAEGCYIRLLCRSWRSQAPGRIPDRLVPEMAGMHRLEPDRVALVEAQLEAAFDLSSEPGFWIQRRMVIEYRRASTLTRARERGGRNRWKDNNNRAHLKDSSRTLRGNRDVDREEDRNKDSTPLPTKRSLPLAVVFPDWLPPRAWQDFHDFRQAQNRQHPWTKAAQRLAVRTLDKLRAQGHDPAAVLEQSVLNGWRGLFALRSEATGATTSEPIPDPMQASIKAHIERKRQEIRSASHP